MYVEYVECRVCIFVTLCSILVTAVKHLNTFVCFVFAFCLHYNLYGLYIVVFLKLPGALSVVISLCSACVFEQCVKCIPVLHPVSALWLAV